MTPGKAEHAVESAREAGNGPTDGVPTDGVPTELGRLLEEALGCLEDMDLPGANAALRKAHAEAASPRNTAGPTGHAGADGGAVAGGRETEEEPEHRAGGSAPPPDLGEP